jgi:hypothetical protein
MHNIVKAFIHIYTGLILVLFLWNSVSTIRFPFGVDYGEAPLMDQVRRVENGETLYKSIINEPPYIIANYPPLYPYWVAATNFLLKIPLFQAGRITSLLFSLLSGFILGLFTFHLTKNKWFGVFSAALFWGHPYVMIWSSLARVDLMALAFSLLGLWILYRYRDSQIGLMLACICFLASAFTRQTYILSGPLAGFVWLWHFNRRQALIFISSFGVIGLLLFGTINTITHGGFFINIVVANINQYVIYQALTMGRQLFSIWPIILISCAMVIILTFYTRNRGSLIDQVQPLQQDFIFYGLVFYSLGALITAGTIGKVGSNVNYFLELIAVCTIWCGLALKLIMDQKNKVKLIFLGLLFVQSVWVLGYSYILSQITIGDLWGKIGNYESLNEKVQIAVQKGVVLSDDFMDMVVLSGQPIYYQPFEYGELYYAGLWDPTEFINQINQNEFPLIIISGNTLEKNCCWVPSVVDALEVNYQIDAENDVLILTPMR